MTETPRPPVLPQWFREAKEPFTMTREERDGICDAFDLLEAALQEARAERDALKHDAIFLAREAGNTMPVDELLTKLRAGRLESGR